MKTKNYLFGIAALALAVAIWLSGGCSGGVPGKVTGGGTIPSTSGVSGDTANFGFNANSCNFNGSPSSISGQFNYLDINAPDFQPGGVKMSGDVVDAAQCVSSLSGTLLDSACALCAPSGFQGLTFYGVVVNYRSTNPNPNFSGIGTALACVADGGKGVNATSDFGGVAVVSGPFSGYENVGQVQGKIQGHPCK